jgi:hypothetical protein
VPVGLETVTIAFPYPNEQSTVCTGAVGKAGCGLIPTFSDSDDVHPAALVTVKLYKITPDPDGSPEIVMIVPTPDVVTVPE